MGASRWPMRIALLLMTGGALAFAVALFDFGSGRQSGDSYVVLDVVGGGDGGRFAVVERYTPASGSAAVTGVWIGSSAPPERGARRAPEGDPVAVWRESVPRLTWQGSLLRVIGSYERVRREAGKTGACLTDAAPAWDLCIDPVRVVFAPLPR